MGIHEIHSQPILPRPVSSVFIFLSSSGLWSEPLSLTNMPLKPYYPSDCSVIGPMVMSYIAVKPGNEMKQCSQCAGPREVRWRWSSTLFPMPIQYEWCQCDGNGMCRWSLEDSPLGPRMSLRCTCIKDCVHNMTEQQMRQQQQMFRSAWTAKAVIVAWVISQRVQRG